MTVWAVTGAGGMLGTEVVAALRAGREDVRVLTSGDLDVRSPEACLALLEGADVVVNAAAWTDVDGAEAHEADAFAVNATGAANVAKAAAAHGAVLVHVSTDYVFSGGATRPYTVDDPVDPLNAYGRTKAAGEWAVRSECASSYVVRTAWLYGAHGPCFPRTMLRLAAERETVDVVDDQLGQPTWTGDLSTFLLSLVRQRAPFGVRHATSSGRSTWYGFAREIFRLAGLDPERVRPTSSDRFRRPAARPGYSVLENGERLPPWEDGLARAWPSLVATDDGGAS
jgi:dTDP-4-dehydrorhamnose reductase